MANWQVMKMFVQMKKEKNVKMEPNADIYSEFPFARRFRELLEQKKKEHLASMSARLETPTQKAHCPDLQTVAQVKKEKNVQMEPNPDSLYTQVPRRCEYVPQLLKVPRSLQAALPYKYKPKHQAAVALEDRVPVVKEPHEEKLDRFMRRCRALLEEEKRRNQIAMKAKKAKFLKKKKEEDAYRAWREKQRKKAACRQYSLKNKSKNR